MKKVLKNLMLVMVMTLLCMAVAVTADAASSGDFTYKVVNGEATITGYTGNGGAVAVPSELGGYPVTTIGRYAFGSVNEDMDTQLPAYKITSLTLPETIKSIEESAFMRVNYSNMAGKLVGFNKVSDLTVYIPAGVENMNITAFFCMEAKFGTEKYTDLKINVLYGGSEAQWKEFEAQWAEELKDSDFTGNDADVNTVIDGCKIRVEIEMEIPTEDTEIPIEGLGALCMCIYNDKNTVMYNCPHCEHPYVSEWYREEPNCGNDGYVQYYCFTCDRILYTETLPATGQHNWNGGPSNSGFDCTLGGNWDYYCSDCGQSKTEYVAPKETHIWSNYLTDEELASFCGERQYYLCCEADACEYYDYIYFTGTAEHDWVSEDYDCEEGGTVEYACNNCYTERYETVEPKDHEWDNYPTDEELSTFCHEKYFYITCKNCYYDYETNIRGTKDHDIRWWSNDDATCTEDGTKSSYCNNCDTYDAETVTDVGSALGHDYHSKWTVLTTATCTYPGISVRACKRCADIESSTEAPYGHFDNDEDGKCDECKVIIEIYAPNDPSIPADPPVYPGDPDDTHTEHTYGEWTEKDNIMYRVCTGCGDVETKEIESTPEDPSKDCSCNCHKGGIMGIIWKILRFFYKLFRINPVCACGIAHY